MSEVLRGNSGEPHDRWLSLRFLEREKTLAGDQSRCRERGKKTRLNQLWWTFMRIKLLVKLEMNFFLLCGCP